MSKVIHNERELMEHFGFGDAGFSPENEQRLSKAIYKATACGAWAALDVDGVRFGTIVEGSDAEFEASKLHYPIDVWDIQKALDWLEDEAELAWREANEGEEE